MAEYLDDFNNVDAAQDFRTRLLEARHTITNRLDQTKGKKNVKFLCGLLSIMLSDTYNNNLSLSVAKTSTFSGHKMTVRFHYIPFSDCRLQRSPQCWTNFKNCCPH